MWHYFVIFFFFFFLWVDVMNTMNHHNRQSRWIDNKFTYHLSHLYLSYVEVITERFFFSYFDAKIFKFLFEISNIEMYFDEKNAKFSFFK